MSRWTFQKDRKSKRLEYAELEAHDEQRRKDGAGDLGEHVEQTLDDLDVACVAGLKRQLGF